MPIGRVLLYTGIGLALLGTVLTFAPSALHWFGRLPGDIRIEGERTFVSIPLTSMLLLSVAASLLVPLIVRIFSR